MSIDEGADQVAEQAARTARPSRRVAVVVNKRSGAALAMPDLETRIVAGLTARGLTPFVVPEVGRGPRDRLERALDEAPDIVVVAGGDGTMAGAAAVLQGSSTVLGVIPAGTMNLFARQTGIPLGLEDALNVIAQGEATAVDVLTVNDNVFLCASMLGHPARLQRHRERERRARRVIAYAKIALIAIQAAVRYPARRFRFSLDGGPLIEIRTQVVTVMPTNTKDPAGPGHLEIHAMRAPGLMQWVRVAVKAMVGNWRDDANVETRVADEARFITSRKRLRVMNDGEVVLLAPPVTYRIKPAALRVLVPPGRGRA